MTRRFIIVHGVWLLCTVLIAITLWQWSWAAAGFSTENMAKPFRPYARFIFSGMMIVLLTYTQALVARKFPF